MTGGILEGDCVQDHGGRLEVAELGDPLKNAESSDKSRLDSNTSTLYVKKKKKSKKSKGFFATTDYYVCLYQNNTSI